MSFTNVHNKTLKSLIENTIFLLDKQVRVEETDRVNV